MISHKSNPPAAPSSSALAAALQRHGAVMTGAVVQFPDGTRFDRGEFEAWDAALQGLAETERDLRASMAGIATRMQDALVAFVIQGRPTGDFLRAALCNRFREAVLLADDDNVTKLPSWARALYNLPRGCWGSDDKVKAWQDRGGLAGKPVTRQTRESGL